MAVNAFVVWSPTIEPWLVEHQLIRTIDLPLNLDQNRHNDFHTMLSSSRSEVGQIARSLPVV